MINDKFDEWVNQNVKPSMPISDGKDIEPVSTRTLTTAGYFPRLNQDSNLVPVCEDYKIVSKQLIGVFEP